MALNTDITLRVGAAQTDAAAKKSSRPVVELVAALTNGTAAGKADLMYYDDSRTLGASASASYDLAGSLSDPFGTVLTFVKVKAIAIVNSGAGSITIARPATNGAPIFDAASDAITVPTGGTVFLYNPTGWNITAGTGDLLSVTADGTGATFEILIVGTSA